MRVLKLGATAVLALGVVWACGFDSSLREYLDARFWLPFSKHMASFEKAHVRRVSAAFAGMMKAQDERSLSKLRGAYQKISQPSNETFDPTPLRQLVAAARADGSLSAKEREEVTLIDAKVDMRLGQADMPKPLRSAQAKFEEFLKTAHRPEYLSEARGWLAYVHFLLGEQTAAGKIYLEELNRDGSNLSRETVLNSLQITYGYDGGAELLANLGEYFDTPEHAVFALELVTNPHWNSRKGPVDDQTEAYRKMVELVAAHRGLLDDKRLALLSMRTAVRMADLPEALKIAEMVPRDSDARKDPDFLWMLGSARFLSHEYAAAEGPLVQLFDSALASKNQKAAAAYGLCGVYEKTGNAEEQLRFALWLYTAAHGPEANYEEPTGVETQSIYWAPAGWDLNLLLEMGAPDEALESFVQRYAQVRDVKLVRYALAVRRARANRYDEAAEIYAAVGAPARAARMKQMAMLWKDAGTAEGKYRLAEFMHANPDRLYFNDRLWNGMQRYAFTADSDTRLTLQERETLMAQERQLKDDQDERWHAYLLLRDAVMEAGHTELGKKAARLAVACLRGINTDRFGREDEVHDGDVEMSKWLAE